MNTVKLNGTNHADTARTHRNVESGQVTGADSASRSADTGSSSVSDSVRVSDRAATVGRLVKRTAELPDIRRERVESLQELVQSGSYEPAASDIADAILQDEK